MCVHPDGQIKPGKRVHRRTRLAHLDTTKHPKSDTLLHYKEEFGLPKVRNLLG
jgi:hypothetical protein